MPQAIVGVIAMLGVPGLVTTTGALTLGGNLLAGAIGIGISYGAQALFAEDAPKPAEMKGILRQSVSARRKAYGEGPMGGTTLFFEIRNGALWIIQYHGEGEIDAFTGWYIDDRAAVIDSDGTVTTEGFYNKIHLQYRLGTATQAYYSSVAAVFPEIYDDTHRADGCVTVRIKADKVSASRFSKVYPNRIPQVVPIARRNKVFDPRSGLTEYSSNLPLIFRSWLTDRDGAGISPAYIDDDDFAVAAESADDLLLTSGGGTVRRYHGQLDYRFDEEPISIIERMIVATDGRLFLKRSGKIGFKAGIWEEPTVSIPDACIISYDLKDSSGPLREGTEVTVRYQNKLARYTEATCDPWIIDADGTRKPIPVQAYEIQEHHHARRVAKLKAERATARWRGTIVTDLWGLEAWEERRIYLQVIDLGIDFEPFEIVDIREGDDDMSVILEVCSCSAGMYDLSLDEEGVPPVVPEDIDEESLLPPQGLVVTGSQRVVAGGMKVAVISASWDAYEDRDDLRAVAEISVADDDVWSPIPVNDAETGAEVIGLVDGGLYDVRVRWEEVDGSPSDWAVVENVLALSDPDAPAAPLSTQANVSGVAVSLSAKAANDNTRYLGFKRGTPAQSFAAAAQINGDYIVSPNQVVAIDDPSGPGYGHWKYWFYSKNGSGVICSAPISQLVDILGPELVSNGSMASDTVWTKGTGWTIASGVATHAAGSTSDISQALSVTAGETYELTYTVSGRSAGSVTPRFTGGSTVSGISRSANGTFTETLTAVSGNTTLAFQASSTAVLSIDNISLKRVG